MRKTFFALLLFLSFCVVDTNKASAHATPITYEPAAASVLEIAPQKVRIRFSERIESVASSITVFAPDGSKLELRGTRIDPGDARIFEASLPQNIAIEGTYAASWQVVSSDDGHFTKGAFSFSVGKASVAQTTAGQIQIQHITTVPQSAMIGIELVGQALLIGVLFLLAVVFRRLRRSKLWDSTSFPEKTFRNLVLVGIFLIVTGSTAFILIKTFDLQQLQSKEFSTTLRMFLATTDGSFALYRSILALVFGAVFFRTRKHIFASEKITKAEWVLGIIYALMILDRSRVSHAAASHFLPLFSVFMNAVHLFFKEAWIGGILALSALVLPIYRKSKSLGAYALSLFSMRMSFVVAVVTITGCYVVWLHLKDPTYIFTTQWGGTFIVLTLFATVLAGLRFYHQIIADYASKRVSAVGKMISALMSTTILLEALVSITVLFTTSTIIITTPPYPPPHFAFEKTATSEGAIVSLALSPTSPERDFLVSITDEKTGNETTLAKAVITLTNSEKSIGPIVADTTTLSPGTVSFPRMLLSPPGSWNIHITGQRTDAYDTIGAFTVNYPADIENSKISGEARTFGTFEGVLLALIVAAIIFAWIVFRWSKKIVASYESLDADVPDTRTQIPFSLEKIIALSVCVVVIFFVSFARANYFTTPFEKLCKKNGHFWLQSVPVFDGVALSSDTTTGCFLDVGMYHFSDLKSYQTFYKPLQVTAELATPPQIIAGRPAELQITIHQVDESGIASPAKEIGTYHDRILHVTIVDEKFETFSHIHPEDVGIVTDKMKDEAQFTLQHVFPHAGKFALNISYVAQGKERSDLVFVNVGGSVPLNSAGVLPNGAKDSQEFDGYKITLKTPKNIRAGEKIKLKYTIEKEGEPARDLEPYLAAAMHIAIVKEDLTRFAHTHGEALLPGSVWFQQLFGKYKKYHTHFAPEKFGPNMITQPWTTIFPTAGTYHVLGEFKHEGEIVTSHFVVTVVP